MSPVDGPSTTFRAYESSQSARHQFLSSSGKWQLYQWVCFGRSGFSRCFWPYFLFGLLGCCNLRTVGSWRKLLLALPSFFISPMMESGFTHSAAMNGARRALADQSFAKHLARVSVVETVDTGFVGSIFLIQVT